MSTFVLVPGAGGMAWHWHLVEQRLRECGHEAIALDVPAEDPDGSPRITGGGGADALIGPFPGVVISDRWNGFERRDPHQRRCAGRTSSAISAATPTGWTNRRPSASKAWSTRRVFAAWRPCQHEHRDRDRSRVRSRLFQASDDSRNRDKQQRKVGVTGPHTNKAR